MDSLYRRLICHNHLGNSQLCSCTRMAAGILMDLEKNKERQIDQNQPKDSQKSVPVRLHGASRVKHASSSRLHESPVKNGSHSQENPAKKFSQIPFSHKPSSHSSISDSQKSPVIPAGQLQVYPLGSVSLLTILLLFLWDILLLNTFRIIFAQVPNAQIIWCDDILQFEAAQSDAVVASELHDARARAGENTWWRYIASTNDSSSCSVVKCYWHKIPATLTPLDIHVRYCSCYL